MPSIDKSKGSQKKRLGRGLGSLLTTDAATFEDSGEVVTQKQSLDKAKKHKEKPVAAQPKKQVSEKPEPRKQAEPVEVPAVAEKKEVVEKVEKVDPYSRIWTVAIEKIIPNQTQPRKDFLKEPLEELSLSIKEQGVLQPITVRKKGESYEIIAGERRWRASQLAGLKSVPVIVKDVDDQKSMELALIENLQREDLNPIEEAMGYQLLIDDYDLSQQELATKVGKSRSAVTNSLRILVLPRDVRQMLRQGLLSLGHAKVLLGVDDVKKQVSLARKVIQKKLSVRALEKEVSKTKKANATDFSNLGVSEKLADNLAEELQKAMGTKVRISYKNGKGQIQIAFYSDDELSSLSEKLKSSWANL